MSRKAHKTGALVLNCGQKSKNNLFAFSILAIRCPLLAFDAMAASDGTGNKATSTLR